MFKNVPFPCVVPTSHTFVLHAQDMSLFFAGRKDDIALSSSLRQEISLQLHARTVLECKLFRQSDPNFIHSIVNVLALKIACPNDYIVRTGEKAEEMYFLTKGDCAVVNVSAWSASTFAHTILCHT